MKDKTIDELLEKRGRQYGRFRLQVTAITSILNILRGLRNEQSPFIGTKDAYNFFLVLKLCRMQTANDLDSIKDIEGYARLIRKDMEELHGREKGCKKEREMGDNRRSSGADK